jgi:FkbM family methyltransferase
MGHAGPGSLEVAGYRVDYFNESHALFLVHEVFVNAEYDFTATTARPRIIDCGANIGMAVLFFKARYPESEILAFEPDPGTFARLRHTIQSNGVRSVAVEQAAVTECGGTVRLYRSRSDPGSIVASIDRAWGGEESDEVPAVRLSDRITAPVDFLKVDIEGAEYGVVRDLVKTDAIRWVREAAIEYHHLASAPDGLDGLTRALGGAGFDVRVTPARDGSPTGLVRACRK